MRIVDPTTEERPEDNAKDFIYKTDSVVFEHLYENERQTSVIFRKVGVNNADPSKEQTVLGGAKFSLYQAKGANHDEKDKVVVVDGQPLENMESDPETGIFWQGVLPDGYYLLEETKAPNGYNRIEGYIRLTVNQGNVTPSFSWSIGDISSICSVTSEDNVFTVTAVNTSGVSLPSTGGPGTLLYTVTGVLMILGAAVLLVSTELEEIIYWF